MKVVLPSVVNDWNQLDDRIGETTVINALKCKVVLNKENFPIAFLTLVGFIFTLSFKSIF